MTFADQRRENLLRVFLLGEFSEEVDYYAGGEEEEATIRAVIQPAKRPLNRDDTEEAEVEQIDVRVSNDADATIDGQTVGGIEDPQLGDGLLRSGGDAATDLFSFVEVLESTAVSWLLRYERRRVRQIGTRQTRG